MEKKILGYSLTVMLIVSALAVLALPVKASPGADLKLIDPIDGDNLFYFTTSEKAVGDTFRIDVIVSNAPDLFSWQIHITWNPELLEYSSIDKTGTVFEGKTIVEAIDTSTPGHLIYGQALLTPPGVDVTEGKLITVILKIIKGPTMLNPVVECDLNFTAIGTDTFLLNSGGSDIEIQEILNAHYKYEWVVPQKKPRFYLSPSTIKPAKLGDTFTVDVMIADVDSAWEIIAVQFSVMWNTTLIEPVAPYWAPGTFFEAFQYAPDGVLYAADINTHARPPPMTPIPDDYNYSTIGILLLPDPATSYTYHPPFPRGDGKLATLYFKAIYETLAPLEVWSKIEFITFRYPDGSSEDMLVLNTYGLDIGYSRADPADYRAPVKTLGLVIDVYTQYPFPYGGQEAHKPSDMFGPQQQVELFAKVTYNEYPVQQKLVGFEIHHGDYVFWREATTDADGVAHISFRIPWPCENPEDEIFGKWYVIATVEVAERKVNDTLGFWVWWPVEILSIEAKKTEFYHRSKTVGDPMTFTVTFRTYSMQTIPAVITTTVYDELGFFIGSDYKNVTVGWGEYKYYNFKACEEPPAINYTWDVSIPMPTNAVVGYGTAYANAFDKFPWLGGTPYCPEAETPFQSWRISKS
jgi:hypothetical protein